MIARWMGAELRSKGEPPASLGEGDAGGRFPNRVLAFVGSMIRLGGCLISSYCLT